MIALSLLSPASIIRLTGHGKLDVGRLSSHPYALFDCFGGSKIRAEAHGGCGEQDVKSRPDQLALNLHPFPSNIGGCSKTQGTEFYSKFTSFGWQSASAGGKRIKASERWRFSIRRRSAWSTRVWVAEPDGDSYSLKIEIYSSPPTVVTSEVTAVLHSASAAPCLADERL